MHKKTTSSEVPQYPIGKKVSQKGLCREKTSNNLVNILNLLKGKPYAPNEPSEVELLNKIRKTEIIRRIALETELAKYNIRIVGFHDFENRLGKIKWTEKLRRKLDLVKGKSYAPSDVFEVVTLNKISEEEIKRRIELETELYIILDFYNFDQLGEITWTEELRRKLDLVKGKSYAPSDVSEVASLNEISEEEIERRISLITEFESIGGKHEIYFRDFIILEEERRIMEEEIRREKERRREEERQEEEERRRAEEGRREDELRRMDEEDR